MVKIYELTTNQEEQEEAMKSMKDTNEKMKENVKSYCNELDRIEDYLTKLTTPQEEQK